MRITVSDIPEGGIEEDFEIPMTVEEIGLQDKVRLSFTPGYSYEDVV